MGVRTPVYGEPVNPHSLYAPRLAYSDYGSRWVAWPYALNFSLWAMVLSSIASVIGSVIEGGASWPAIAVLIFSGLASSVGANRFRHHPLYGINNSDAIMAYQSWYDLPSEPRFKVPLNPSSLKKVVEADKVGSLKTSIEQLHELEKKRKLAEARLDSTATDLLESARQAAEHEREYLNQVQALEA